MTINVASRKKFAQIAKVFSRGKRGTGARSLLPAVGGSASANGKDLLMSSDPLIDDYDEDRPQSVSSFHVHLLDYDTVFCYSGRCWHLRTDFIY